MMMVSQRIRLLSMMMMIQRMKHQKCSAEDEIIIDGDGEKDEVIPETKEDTLDDLFGIAGEVHEDELIDDDDEDEVISEDDSSSQNDSADEEEDEDDEEDEISDDIHASDTVLDIFGTVTGVESIKSQLAKTFTKFEDPALDNRTCWHRMILTLL